VKYDHERTSAAISAALPCIAMNWDAVLEQFFAAAKRDANGTPTVPWEDASGWWVVYSVGRRYCGPEEGGTWADVGSVEAAIRSSRRVVMVRDNSDLIDPTKRRPLYCDERADGLRYVDAATLAVCAALEREHGPRCGFGGSAGNVGGAELRLCWHRGDELPPAGYDEGGSYE
jgi:hypothetical protein